MATCEMCQQRPVDQPAPAVVCRRCTWRIRAWVWWAVIRHPSLLRRARDGGRR